MSTPLYGHLKILAEATGVTDPAVLREIEDIMRVQQSTLDGLDLRQLRRLAREAYDAYFILREED